MQCQRCGTENPADAVFCKQCGMKLSAGTCPACGKTLPENARFCSFCGTPVPAQTVPQQPAPKPRASAKSKDTAQKVLGYVGNACAMMGALISFIFVFLIGTSIAGTGTAPGISEIPMEMQGSSLFDYFGRAYDSVAEALEALRSYPSYYPTSLYLSTVFGTVAAAAALIATSVLFILTLVRFLLNLSGKTQKSAGGLGLATFFSFLVGALLFLSVERASIDITYSVTGYVSAVNVSAASVLNGATVAGICIGAVFVAGSLGCAIARGGRGQGQREALFRYIFCGIGLVLSVTFFALLTDGCIQLSQTLASGDTTATMGMTIGFTGILQIIGYLSLSVAADTTGAAIPVEYAGDFNLVLILSLIGLVLLFALGAVLVVLAVKYGESLAQRRKRTFALSVTAAVLAILCAVFAAIVADKAAYLLNTINGGTAEDAVGTKTVTTILVAIFAAIAFIAAAVDLAISPKKSAAPAPAYAPYAAPAAAVQPAYPAQPVQQPVPPAAQPAQMQNTQNVPQTPSAAEPQQEQASTQQDDPPAQY